MKDFFYFSDYRINDDIKVSALLTLISSSYLLFIYKNLIPSAKTNIPSEVVLKKIYSVKYHYTRLLEDNKTYFNMFEKRVLTNVLYILNNGFDKKPTSEYLKYDIEAILQYISERRISLNNQYVQFIKFFCNLYNLNQFEGKMVLPRFIFDEDLIMVGRPINMGNINIAPERNTSHRNYLNTAIFSVLKTYNTLDMTVLLCDTLYVEYSHVHNFNSFSITEICRKIVNNNYNFSILKNYCSSVIIPSIFANKLTSFLFFNNKQYDRYMYKLINLDYYDYEIIKKELCIQGGIRIPNYHMKNIYDENKSLEALDDEDAPDDEGVEDETTNEDSGDELDESNVDDTSDDAGDDAGAGDEDDPGDSDSANAGANAGDDAGDDAGDTTGDSADDGAAEEEPSKKDNVIKFKFKLADPDESLEDFLYKIHVYKVIDEYLNKEESIKLSHTKRTVLRNWLTKWIFLLSASETKLLLNDFKIKL